jgi:hypothetical protein
MAEYEARKKDYFYVARVDNESENIVLFEPDAKKIITEKR